MKSIEDQTFSSNNKLLNLVQPKLTNTHLVKKSTNDSSSAHINLLNSLLNSNNSRLVKLTTAQSSSSSSAQNSETSSDVTSLVSTSSTSNSSSPSPVDTNKLFEALQSIKILNVKQADTDLKIQYYNRFLLFKIKQQQQQQKIGLLLGSFFVSLVSFFSQINFSCSY